PEPAGARRGAHPARKYAADPGGTGRRRAPRARRLVRSHCRPRLPARPHRRRVAPAARGRAAEAGFSFFRTRVDYAMNAPDFAQRLVQALGPDTVLTAPDDIAPWLSDWRGLYNGRAQAVVRPRRTEDVAQGLALCQQAGVTVVPRGGNTGMCGGATPDTQPANVVLALDRMNAVRAIDTVANTMVAEAGCILGNLRRAADEAGRLLPLSLAAEDSCQIGGNVSTNAGGVNVVRYGMTRELVLG